MKEILKSDKINLIAKIIMLVLLLAFAIFNIMYIVKVNGNIESFGMSILCERLLPGEKQTTNLLVFLIFIIILSISYLIISLKSKKDGNIKKAFLFIVLISVLSGIILPNNSTDVFYYMGVGRLDAKYDIDIYKNDFNDVQKEHLDDEIVANSPEIKHKFIYGVIWEKICKFVGSIPIDSELILLYIFKILNIIVHILNCYLIYKITKSKKILYLYGLNPLVLFEGIINCHNDIYLVLFMLLAVYLKKKDKIGLATLSIALGTMIKYTPIIILPYILIDKKWKEKIKYLIYFALTFLLVNLLLTGDIAKILSVLVQTGKYSNSLYLELILLNIPSNIIILTSTIGKIIFCIIFAFAVFNKKIQKSKTYLYLLMLFLLLAITNFKAWYIMWLFGLITEVDNKDVGKIIALSIIAEISNFIFYYFGESYVYGGAYFVMLIVFFSIYIVISDYIYTNKKVKDVNEKTLI